VRIIVSIDFDSIDLSSTRPPGWGWGVPPLRLELGRSPLLGGPKPALWQPFTCVNAAGPLTPRGRWINPARVRRAQVAFPRVT
jgi:hypothetical protein